MNHWNTATNLGADSAEHSWLQIFLPGNGQTQQALQNINIAWGSTTHNYSMFPNNSSLSLCLQRHPRHSSGPDSSSSRKLERELTELMISYAEFSLEAPSPAKCLHFTSWPQVNARTQQCCKHLYNMYKSKANCSWTWKLKGIPFSASTSWASIALKPKWLGHYWQQNHLCKELILVSALQFSIKQCWNWSSDQLLPCSLGGRQTPRRSLRVSLQPTGSHVPYKQLAALNWTHLWY